MNLAYKYPVIFWNCACLISDAGGDGSNEKQEPSEEEIVEENYDTEIEEFGAEEEDDEDEDEDEEEIKETKKKKKAKVTNYGKISTAIGKFTSAGIIVAPPNINTSTFTFDPDVENNAIIHGLSGITRISGDTINTIIAGRPYSSFEDFQSRIKLTKPQMINLIKAGAFDCFGDRYGVMRKYIALVSDTKKRVTLQNLNMLIDMGLIPDEYELQRKTFKFNKYLKKFKNGIVYDIDDVAFTFYAANFDTDKLIPSDAESGFSIKQTDWDSIYQGQMDIIRPYVQKNAADLLNSMNDNLMSATWNKYCLGSISKWEMDSLSYYVHDHELKGVNLEEMGFSDFGELPDHPEVERIAVFRGRQIPIMKIRRICGTVLDRNKAKKTVTLLTTSGVVTVKIYGGLFAQYDKQISEKGADGKKHVIEKSCFSRGNKIVVCGIKTGENEFLCKKYSKTPWHSVENIVDINEDGTVTTKWRATEEEK